MSTAAPGIAPWVMACSACLLACSSPQQSRLDAPESPDAAPPHPDLGPPSYLLRGAAIFDSVSQTPLRGRALVVRGQRIEAIVPDDGMAPVALEVVDLSGHTLVAGFIDVHTHVGIFDDPRVPLERELDFGITAIKDTAAPLERVLRLRAALARGQVEGPRMQVTGPAITAPGGHPAGSLWRDDPWMIQHGSRGLDDARTARYVVDQLAGAGVDQIKCVLTKFEAWIEGGLPRLKLDVLKAVADQARKYGLPVVVHTDTVEDIRDALAAGVDGLEHGLTKGRLDADLAREIAEAGVVYVPTGSLVRQYKTSSREDVVANLRALRQAGAKIAVGTDIGNASVTFGATFSQELVLMVEAGYTPAEALTAATRAGAEHLQLADDLGTLEKGKLADIIAIAGDPLTDITIAYDVKWVMQGGRVLRDTREP